MRGTLTVADGSATRTITDPQSADIATAVAAGARFWLDLSDPGEEEVTLLRDTLALHPLAVDDAEQFGQRPKIDHYDDFAQVVAYGLTNDDRHQQADTERTPAFTLQPAEVHFILRETSLVTVHRGPLPAVAAVLSRLSASAPIPAPIALLYRLLDELVDGYYPHLEAFDDAIDDLQDEILRAPTNAQLGRIFDLKRHLIRIRRLTAEQRDMVEAAVSGTPPLPGMTIEVERYLRDVHDHLAGLAQTADGYRDLLSSALDTYLSTTSNRLNVVMKQLAIIATVFLPMSFLTGFFGQNFGWMVDRIGGAAVFWILGIGTQVVLAAALLVMFRKMGWLGNQ